MLQNLSNEVSQGLLLPEITPQQISNKQNLGESFVVNIVTAWCPDCTLRQAGFIENFAGRMNSAGITVFQCIVQHERGVFLSKEHETLTEDCGGHGYPRTVLFSAGTVVSSNNVEIVTQQQLDQLADLFIGMLTTEEPR